MGRVRNTTTPTTGIATTAGTSLALAPSQGIYTAAHSLALIGVFCGSTTATVSSIAGRGGTYTQLGRVAGGAGSMEVWIGYNFTTATPDGNITVTWNASVTNRSVRINHLWSGFNPSLAQPTVVESLTANATSTTWSPPALTPTDYEDELLVYFGYYPSSTVPTGQAVSPASAPYYTGYGGVVSTITPLLAFIEPISNAAHSITRTIPSSAWYAMSLRLSLPAIATDPSHLYKGRDTVTADLAGVA